MSLQPAHSHLVPTTRAGRALARQLDAAQLSAASEIAQIEARAQVEAVRAQAAGYVIGEGLKSIALLSDLEGRLAQLSPLATTRLAAVTDLGCLQIAQVVADTSRRLR